MINTDYKIDSLDLLLDPGRMPERYGALIQYKEKILAGLRRLGCRTKSDAERLPDEVYAGIGMELATILLFRRFLKLYDPDPKKFSEIGKITDDDSEREALYELYHLPGVKKIRASLYYRSGYKTLADLAFAEVDDVIAKTSATIRQSGAPCAVPLPKEVRTQIAVARAFTAE